MASFMAAVISHLLLSGLSSGASSGARAAMYALGVFISIWIVLMNVLFLWGWFVAVVRLVGQRNPARSLLRPVIEALNPIAIWAFIVSIDVWFGGLAALDSTSAFSKILGIIAVVLCVHVLAMRLVTSGGFRARRAILAALIWIALPALFSGLAALTQSHSASSVLPAATGTGTK